MLWSLVLLEDLGLYLSGSLWLKPKRCLRMLLKWSIGFISLPLKCPHPGAPIPWLSRIHFLSILDQWAALAPEQPSPQRSSELLPDPRAQIWNQGCTHLVLSGGRQEPQKPAINSPSPQSFCQRVFHSDSGDISFSSGQRTPGFTRQDLKFGVVFLPLSGSVRFRVPMDTEKWIWSDTSV